MNIGTHLYDKQMRLLKLDFTRHKLPAVIHPGESFSTRIVVNFQSTGEFILGIDLVSESICWFENMGSEPQYIRIVVR